MSETINEKVEQLSDDIKKIKNDLNIVKANTQVSANLLSILHGDNILEMVFVTAKNEKLCKALILCKEPKTAKDLCENLGIKASNIRKQIIDNLIDASLLTVADKKGQREVYRRALYLDMIGFDQAAVKKYPNLKETI